MEFAGKMGHNFCDSKFLGRWGLKCTGNTSQKTEDNQLEEKRTQTNGQRSNTKTISKCGQTFIKKKLFRSDQM